MHPGKNVSCVLCILEKNISKQIYLIRLEIFYSSLHFLYNMTTQLPFMYSIARNCILAKKNQDQVSVGIMISNEV